MKLSRVEKTIIALYATDENYSLHRCDEHGVHAHRRAVEYLGCPHCHEKFPEVKASDLVKQNED